MDTFMALKLWHFLKGAQRNYPTDMAGAGRSKCYYDRRHHGLWPPQP